MADKGSQVGMQHAWSVPLKMRSALIKVYSASLLLTLVSCGTGLEFTQSNENVSETENSAEEAAVSPQNSDPPVRLPSGNFGTMPPPSGAQLETEAKITATFRQSEDALQLGLVDVSISANYTVVNCASGYIPFGSFTDSATRILYKGDQNCAVAIDSLTLNSVVFTLQSGTFNTANGATNIFSSSESTFLLALITNSQLSSPLEPVGEEATFSAQALATGASQLLSDFLIVTASAASPSVTENSGTTQFNLDVQGTSDSAVTVYYTLSGTALGILDYTPLSGSVIIPPGAPSVSIPVVLASDSIPELSETVSITLHKNEAGYFPVENSPSIQIVDDDAVYPTAGLAARYQPTGFVGSPVSQWTDSTANLLNATQGTAASRPVRSVAALNGFDASVFDGVDDMISPISQTSVLLTNATFTTKTISVVLRTGASVTGKRIIYRQGTSTKGLVLYLDGGNLYFAGYNQSNDDAGATTPWGVRNVSAPVAPNTVYVVRAVFDQPQNEMRLYLNTDLVSSTNSVGRLFSASGISFGRSTASMKYHDSTTGVGTAFGGHIYELAHFNSATPGNEGLGLDVFLFQKYGLDVPLTLTLASAASGISELGGSTLVTVTRNRVGVSELTVPLTISGSATAGVDYVTLPSSVVIPAFESSVSFTLTAIDDVLADSGESVNIALASSANYTLGLPSAISVGIADNESFNTPPSQKIWWRASVGVTQAANVVSSITNQVNASHTLSQGTAAARPLLVAAGINGLPAIKFDGTDDGFTVPNHADIQTLGPYTKRSYAVAFRTDANVTTRQLIWEQGNYTSGINIYLESGQLRFGAWNTNTGQRFGPLQVRANVAASTNYFVTLEFNAITGQLKGRLNGADMGAMIGTGSVGSLPTNTSTGSGAGIGRVNSRTSFYGTNATAATSFRGHLAEFLMFNDALTTAEILEMEGFFFGRYGL